MIKVVGIGAGGHAAVMIEAIQAMGGCQIVGLLDADSEKHGSTVLGIPILGDDSLWPTLIQQGITHFFNGVGSVRDTIARQRVFDHAAQMGLRALTVIQPSATVSPSARLGDGVAVLSRAHVGTRAQLGSNVLINTGALIEHDCVIGDHCHIATGAVLAGSVTIGLGVHVGAGAVILQGRSIGDAATIGAGAVVIHDVEANATAVGVPARPLSKAIS